MNLDKLNNDEKEPDLIFRRVKLTPCLEKHNSNKTTARAGRTIEMIWAVREGCLDTKF